MRSIAQPTKCYCSPKISFVMDVLNVGNEDVRAFWCICENKNSSVKSRKVENPFGICFMAKK